ncbi:MAG: low temperature requirement protein A, partial [Candidatus Nanopelagicales bacterium]
SAGSPELRKATTRLALSTAAAAVLLLVAAVVGGTPGLVLVLLAVAIDPIGAFVGGGRGWYLSADHFAERHGLIIIIAIGESLIAVGLAVAEKPPSSSLIGLGLVGVACASLLYILYFRRAAEGLLDALSARSGAAQARLGRDAFSYGHLLLIAGIISLALTLKKSAAGVSADGLGAHLHGIAGPALALAGLLIIGGMAIIRLRCGLGAPAWLWAGMAMVIAAGAAASMLPLGAVLAIAVAGFACAALPRGGGHRARASSSQLPASDDKT